MDERDFCFGMSKVFFKAGKVCGGVRWKVKNREEREGKRGEREEERERERRGEGREEGERRREERGESEGRYQKKHCCCVILLESSHFCLMQSGMSR